MKGIYCLSMSHRFMNVEVRSRYGVVFQDLESRVKELKYAEIVKEGLIISTCNRLEIVFLGSDLEAVIAWIAFKCCTNYDEVKASFRVMQSMEALKHIYRVISGLDSKIFGETNIVGQVKKSLEIATTHQLAGKTLNFIYQNVYKASKKIHNSLALPVNSLANCFEKAFEKHFPDPRQKIFVTFGSGKLSTEIVKRILKHEPKKLYIVSRNPDRVCGFLRNAAHHIGIIDEIVENFPHVDACFTATNVSETIIHSSHLDMFDKDKNIFISDSSLPPAVCSTVRKYENITYYDIDDLAALSEQKCNLLSKAIEVELDLFIEASIFQLCKELDTNFMQKVIQMERAHLKEYIEHVQTCLPKDSDDKKLSIVIKDLSGVLLHMGTLLLKESCKNHDSTMLQEVHSLIDRHDRIIRNTIQ
ncbi:glutamyl tRNA reductase [Legionella quinlivanii]|uniref:Glutamyl-tRNA reductase n=1 Tax=Legionella quinlivanii TaxID=45073 RepID=A0A0W0Y0W3_9GAMM|nr:hypothetical protein [Legionella quinlivanii]KTD50335.1 glutamyl tRNA reductase [Legionella quinlivanii]SEF43193.1 glutamyl-tRNA reductase [Legionella quinlivanii DSM 21216]STY11935.1 glutamyl tRNA reductase [Legionella quinlivanii]